MKKKHSTQETISITEVAKRAGVSTATVSRFFNNPDVVKSATRKKIETAATELGYIRNRMASAMHHGISGTVGLIVPTIDNAIFAELIQELTVRLLDYDRTLLITTHGYDLTQELNLARSLLERRIDALALVGFTHESALKAMLTERRVPTLEIWNYRRTSTLPCVGADNVEAGYEVTRHILEHGHRNVVLAFPPTRANDRAADRLKGAKRAIEKFGNNSISYHFIETKYDIGKTKEKIRALLHTISPSAIVCGNDVIAQGAVFACQSMGLAIPDQVSIIGIGNFPGSAHMEPGLTTWRLPAREIGITAADVLCGEARNSKPDKHVRIKIDSEIIRRGSVATVSWGSSG